MKFKTSIFLCIICLVVFYTGQIQAIASLGLEDVLRSGLNNNLNIKQSQMEKEKAAYDLELAKKSWNPTLNLQSSYTRLDEGPQQMAGFDPLSGQFLFEEGSCDNFSTQLTVQKTIYGGGQIKAGIEQAEKALVISNLQTEQQKKEVLHNIIQAYYNVLMAKNRVEIEEEALELVREHKRIVKVSYEQGVALKTDMLQTEIKESETVQSLNNARNQLLLARKNLANLARLEQMDYIIKEPDLIPDFKMEAETLYQEAIKNRSELQIMSVNREMVKTNIDMEEKSNLPKLALSSNYSWQGSELNFDNGSWSITLSGALSLYDGGKSESNEKKYRKELSILDKSEENLKEMIKLDIENRVLAARENQDKIQLYELNLVRARENLRLEKIRYREGVGTNIDVINAQTTLKQTKISKMQAEYQYQLKLFELLQTTGQLVEYCKEAIK